MSEDKPYDPDWVSHPCESVLDILVEKNIDYRDFKYKMGWDELRTSKFFDGYLSLDHDDAVRLEKAVGSSSSFWLTRQRQYTEKFNHWKARGAEEGLEILGESELKNPQMLEIFMYEDRKGHHCIVTKMKGKEMRSKIQYRFRHPLHSKPTMDILTKALDLMAGFMAQEEENEKEL